jgi:hypothetical protein
VASAASSSTCALDLVRGEPSLSKISFRVGNVQSLVSWVSDVPPPTHPSGGGGLVGTDPASREPVPAVHGPDALETLGFRRSCSPAVRGRTLTGRSGPNWYPEPSRIMPDAGSSTHASRSRKSSLRLAPTPASLSLTATSLWTSQGAPTGRPPATFPAVTAAPSPSTRRHRRPASARVRCRSPSGGATRAPLRSPLRAYRRRSPIRR